MNWNVYRKEDPNTWPAIKCPMLVYDNELGEFYICDWDNSLCKFVETKVNLGAKVAHYWGECYYAYIDYVPYGYEATKVNKCNSYTKARCQYEDDGYCFDLPRQTKCKYMEEQTEYSLNHERIWKEFKR